MDVTLLELHLPDAQFNTPFTTNQSPETESESGASSDGSSLRPLVAIGVVVALAVLARYLRSSGEAEDERTLDLPA